MSAPRGYAHLTGRGRTTTGALKVPEVESLPCPATLGSETHELAWSRGQVACRWCAESWAALDAEARAS